MYAQNARPCRKALNRPPCLSHLFGRVADQRRQQRGGAVAPMRSDNAGGGGIVVERPVPAAVDLDVDEAGSEPATAGQVMHCHMGRQLLTGAEPLYARRFDENRPMSLHDTAVEDRIGSNGVERGPA